VADDKNMGFSPRLAIGLVCALLGSAVFPSLTAADSSGLLPTVSVPTATLPANPVLPQDNPVQQVVNNVSGTVNQVGGQVQQVVNNPPAPVPPVGSGSGGGGGGKGSSPSSGSSGNTSASPSSSSSSPISSSSSPSGSGSSTGSKPAAGKGNKRGGSGGSGGGGTTAAGGNTNLTGFVAPSGTGGNGGGAKTDPPASKDNNDSVLTRTVHDIVHVVPGWLKPLLVALALAIVGLAVNSFFHTRRARRLARTRDELLDEVGVLQKALLPDVPDRIGGLAVSVAYSPAEGPAAGGDFYDVFPLRGDRVGIIVGDISGHGKRALEHTSLLRYSIRAYLDAGLEPRASLAVAGQTLEDDLDGDFATVVVGIYDSDNGTLVYSTAGHPPPLALGPGEFEPVTVCSSPPVGVNEPTGRRQTTVTLPRGTDLCLYTDGVVEARKNGEMLGRERLAEILGELRPRPKAFEVLSKVSDEIDGSSDDMAICLLTIDSKRAVPAFRLEELELSAAEVDEPHATRFLETCGVNPNRIADALASLRTTAGEFGGAVLRVRIETGETTVTVGSPPGAAAELPALHGVRLAAPVDL
jgi:hypothetical protein